MLLAEAIIILKISALSILMNLCKKGDILPYEDFIIPNI